MQSFDPEDSALIRVQRALELMEKARFTDAASVLVRTIDIHGADAKKVALLIECHYKSGRIDNALQCLKDYDFQEADFIYNKIRVLAATGRIEAALSLVQQVPDDSFYYPKAHFEIALLYLRSRRPSQALEEIDMVLRLDSDDNAIAVRVDALAASGRRDEALEYLRQALRDNPHSGVLIRTRINYDIEQGMFDSAVARLHSLEQLNDKSHWTHLAWAKLYFEQRDYLLSKKSLQKGLDLQPNNPDLLYMRAWINYRLKDWAGSMSDLRTVIANDPSNRKAIAFLAVQYIKKLWLRKAYRLIARYLADDSF